MSIDEKAVWAMAFVLGASNTAWQVETTIEIGSTDNGSGQWLAVYRAKMADRCAAAADEALAIYKARK